VDKANGRVHAGQAAVSVLKATPAAALLRLPAAAVTDMLAPALVMLLLLAALTVYGLFYYGDRRKITPAVFVIAFLGWYLPFSIVFLVPLDILGVRSRRPPPPPPPPPPPLPPCGVRSLCIAFPRVLVHARRNTGTAWPRTRLARSPSPTSAKSSSPTPGTSTTGRRSSSLGAAPRPELPRRLPTAYS